MYLEDEFDLTAERSRNPGRYIPTEEDLIRLEEDRQAEEELRELEEQRHKASTGRL